MHCCLRPKRRGDEGFTLVEILIAVALLGSGAVTGLAAITTLASSSSLSRDRNQVQTVLNSAAEVVLNDDLNPYDSTHQCAALDLSALQSRLPTQPVQWTLSQVTTSVEYWQRNPAGGAESFGATCNDSFELGRLRRITITVSSPDHRISNSLVVVKRGD